MLTVALVWSSSLLIYFIGVFISVLIGTFRGNDYLENADPAEIHEAKKSATIVTTLFWGICAILLYNNSYEWALALGSLITILTVASVFAPYNPKLKKREDSNAIMGSSLFIWAVVGAVIMLM